MNKMIAYCGFSCGKYDAYLVIFNDDHELREKNC